MDSDYIIPLEANPDTFTPLAAALGLDTTRYALHDVLGLDAELLGLVPQPVAAAILLFPSPLPWDDPRVVEEDAAEAPVDTSGLVYFRQRLSNHCGTLALLHALANTPELPLADGPMKTLFARCRGLAPDASAALLGATGITSLHTAAARTGQSDPHGPLHAHYLAFVAHGGELLELDGWGHAGPRTHGALRGGLLQSAAEVVRRMMAETGSIEYSLMAIAPTQG